MPLRYDLTLTLERRPERELERHLHALVFALWRPIDPAGAAQHHAANASPFSLAFEPRPLEGPEHQTLSLRLNLLEESLHETFDTFLHPGARFGEGEQLCGQLEGVRRSGERYARLLERYLNREAPRVLELEFLSCTCLTSAGTSVLEPHPEPLFKGVLKRFQTFTGERHPPALFEYLKDSVHLEAQQLERSYANLERDQWVRGFKGRARYRLERESLEGRWVGLLAELAGYTGVGKRVAYGCGQVRSSVQDAWW